MPILARSIACPPRHTLVTGGLGQQAAQRGLHTGRGAGSFRGEDFKRQCLQGIARQQGLGFAKLHVHRGFAAAQDVVVHARHVVMHQGIGVDQLGGAGGAQGGVIQPGGHVCGFTAGHRFARSQYQQRAQALATVQHGVAHAFAQGGWGRMVGIDHATGGHPVAQRFFHHGQCLGAPAR